MDLNQQLMSFIKKAPTPFQTIEEISNILDSNGFIKLNENEKWINKSGKFYTIRNNSSIIAFTIPNEINDYHYQICSSHSDSPTFKIKNISEIQGPKNYTKLNVEMYGGAISYSWLDKPLTLAGRVLIKNGNQIKATNLFIDKDLLIIPSLPIHFNRDVNKGYEFNVQIDLCPILLCENEKSISLQSIIANYLNIEKENIVSYDLFLVNRQLPVLIGNDNELLSAPRLDDLEASFVSLKSFIDSQNNNSINVYACFDNEEVGSLTKQGANSTFLFDTLNRINILLDKSNEDFYNAISKSFNISFDNAHALHPNRQEKYDVNNCCLLNKGIVIKENASQSYTTDAFSRAIFEQICDTANVPYQSFANRSDTRGGSTLGNLSNQHVSMHTVDIGLAQLAMHSSFETAGSKDTEYAYDAIKNYYSSNIIINNSDSFTIK